MPTKYIWYKKTTFVNAVSKELNLVLIFSNMSKIKITSGK